MTTKPLTDLTEEQLRLEVAKRLWVPCACSCHMESIGPFGECIGSGHTGECSPPCVSGRVYPLREPCEYQASPVWMEAVRDAPEERAFAERRNAKHPRGECGCAGRGWTPKQVSELEVLDILAGTNPINLQVGRGQMYPHHVKRTLWTSSVGLGLNTWHHTEGKNPQLAVWRALVAALRERDAAT